MKRKRSYSRVTKQALSLFGKLIRVARTTRGMTAQDLADLANISRTTLYNIEKGASGPEIGTGTFYTGLRISPYLAGKQGE